MLGMEEGYEGRLGEFLVELCGCFLRFLFHRVARTAESDAIGVSFDSKIGSGA